MLLKELKPKKALNKAFLKVKPNRIEIEKFKANLIALIDQTNDLESEEFHKNLVIDFLKKTFFDYWLGVINFFMLYKKTTVCNG